MQVLFDSRDADAARLRSFVVRRASFVMRRLSWLVPRARIEFSDLNGPRGGVDKRCRVELRGQRIGPVVITSVARDWRSALDSALSRATRVALRLLRRSQSHRLPMQLVAADGGTRGDR